MTEQESDYLVSARKYRPSNFAEMKGQDALVRTLSNAIESDRLAQAFMLTGVRGVGKTTAARIVARALNCEQGPTVNPCGVCEQCKGIAEDRNMDVLEMDAASQNSVEDIRNIVDSVQYSPVAGRYKIFILDEVHMLSKAAFNALLKTLEEPPPHVKFIFATTEIRKVPVTVLSRCQRFDLRRIGADVLEEHFAGIAEKENREAEQGAIALIARAADGSFRDGLSLLDQAMAHETGKITETQVREMLGLADRAVTLDLFEAVMAGDSEKSLAHLDDLYKSGADATMVLQDLQDLTHYITKVKVAPDVAKDMALPEAERVRGLELANKLAIPALTRTWQMLLKGAQEVLYAANPQLALEMLIIRLIYVSDQPTPSDLLKKLNDGNGAVSSSTNNAPRGNSGGSGGGATSFSTAPVVEAFSQTEAVANVNNFQEAVALFETHREMLLRSQIVNFVHLVKFEQGHISIRVADGAPRDLSGQMAKKLSEWTGKRWMVSLSREQGEPTLSEQTKKSENALLEEIQQHPVVSEILKTFSGAKVIEIKDKEDA